MKSALVSSLFLALAFAAPATAADPVTIKMDRPEKKGAKYETVVEYQSKTRQGVSAGGRPLQESVDVISGKLEGVAEVLDVDAAGTASRISIAVKSLVLEIDDKEKELLKDGKVLVVDWRSGKAEFTMDGEEAGSYDRRMHDGKFSQGPFRKSASRDEIFDTKEQPRAAGTEWAVKVKPLIAGLAEDFPVNADPDGSAGKVKFEKTEKIDAGECHIVSSSTDLNVTGVKKLPEGFQPAKTAASVAFTETIPADAEAPLPASETTVKVELAGSIRTPGGVKTIQIRIATTRSEQRKPVK